MYRVLYMGVFAVLLLACAISMRDNDSGAAAAQVSKHSSPAGIVNLVR